MYQKKSIDVSYHLARQHRVFTYDVRGFQTMSNWVVKQTKEVSVFYYFENTGIYSLKLASYLSYKGVSYAEESPIKIKRSSGLVREKTDKIDSEIIARYAWIHREESVSSELKSVVYQELGRLIGA